MKIHFVLLGIAIGSTGCMSWGDCVKGSGASVRKELQVAPFEKLVTAGSIDVVIEKGDAQRVEIEGPQNIIDLINTDVKSGLWEIDTKKCFSTNTNIIVHITTPALASLGIEGSGDITSANVFDGTDASFTISGSGDITVSSINAKEVSAEIAGSGSIRLAGTCASLKTEIAGSGDVHALDLTGNEVNASIQGSGSLEVTAISTLDASIQGSGNVHYKGKPQVNTSIQGSGAVTPVE